MEKNSFIRFGISEKCYIHVCIKDLEGELSYRVIIHNIEYDIASPMFIDYVKEFVFSCLPPLYKNVPEYYKKLANIISEACGHNYITDRTFGKSYYDIVDPKPDYAKFTVYNRDDCLYTALFIKVDRDTNISTRIELSVDKECGVHIKNVDKSNIVKFISRYTYQLFKMDDLHYAPNKANRAERIINHIKRHADLTVKRFDIIDASKDSIIANSNQTDGQ